MKPSVKHLKSIMLLIVIPVLLTFTCCEEEFNDLHVVMRGQVLDKVTGEGIPDISILINISEPTTLNRYTNSTSDENGNFEIKRKVPGCKSFTISGVSEPPNTPKKFQSPRWVNNDSIPYSYELIYNLGPDNLKIELFPRTYFNLKINNIEPSSYEDKLYLYIHNMIQKSSYWDQRRPKEYYFSGPLNDLMIEGELFKEDEIKLVYEVINEEGNNKYSKVFTCKPGGMTEIYIEY
ncbi:MAG: hypothetical protein HKN68_07855 [Saprospiraceae bacterium]|nr:hypothetical protein [Saprospiraceae bacterium]